MGYLLIFFFLYSTTHPSLQINISWLIQNSAEIYIVDQTFPSQIY